MIKDQLTIDVGERAFAKDIISGIYNENLKDILKVIASIKAQETFIPLL